MPMRAHLAAALTGVALFASTWRAARADDPAFYVGVCTHFGQGKGIPQLNLSLMKAAGVNSLRDELSWSGVEQTPGRYTVDPDKSAAFRLAASSGIQPMLIFDYANRHYDGGDRPRSPEAVEGYARYAEFLVKHFSPRIRLVEIWNEYDIGIGMPEPYRQGGSPEDYVRMLKLAYARIKQADPQATVVGGAVTGGGVRRGWLEEIVQRGALDYCDVISIHTYNYGLKGGERTPEGWLVWMLQVQAMLRKYNDGREAPMFVTEMGWPTHVGKSNSTPPELSASYLGRLYLLARTLPFLRGVWWYDYQDDGWNPGYNENNFGIVRPDLTPKPSYYVMADVSAIAARGQYLGPVETEASALRILRFRLDREQVWAAWSADDQPRQIVLETNSVDTPLRLHQLGRPPIERGWGRRDWSRSRGARLAPRQLSLVLDDRPWLIRGGMNQVSLTDCRELVGPARDEASAK